MPNRHTLTCLFITCCFIALPVSADTIHVDDSIPPGGDGSSWALAFNDLQDALDVVSPGDEIRVAGGVYVPTHLEEPTEPRSAAFELPEDVTLLGGYAGFGHPDPDKRDIEIFESVISGDLNGDDEPGFVNRIDNCFHVVHNNESLLSNTSLDGFTLSGGFANEPLFSNNGGGMLLISASPTLKQCTFKDNGGSHGAGLAFNSSSPVLIDCTFTNNKASGFGGGILFSEATPVIERCNFSGNRAVLGGGASSLSSEYSIIDCNFIGNTGTSEGGGMHNLDSKGPITRCTFSGNIGGGMLNDLSSTPELTHCLFADNDAELAGGGMVNLNSAPFLENCMFLNNSTRESGGGLANFQCSPVLVNCIFSNNSANENGGAVYNFILSSTVLSNCTFHRNTAGLQGGAIYNHQSSPVVTSCILWEDSSGSSTPDEIFNAGTSTPAVNYSDVQGGYPGFQNIDADPLFVDMENGDYHLQYLSPCRNAGNGEIPHLPSKDFEGDPRIAQIFIDMGADEFHNHLYCTGDFTPGGVIAGKIVGLPGTSTVGLLFSGDEITPPLKTKWGDFFLSSPWILISLVPVPSSGILELPATLPPTLPAPYDLYLQALIGLDPDSLSNLFVLEVR